MTWTGRPGLTLTLLVGMSIPLVAAAASTNRIHGLKLSHQGESAVVEISGERAPNFTTFKQDTPRRVIVDVAECALGEVPEAIQGDGALIDRITTAQYGDQPHGISRVIIALAREAEYKVTTRGGSLFVLISPGAGGLLVSAGVPVAPERPARSPGATAGPAPAEPAEDLRLPMDVAPPPEADAATASADEEEPAPARPEPGEPVEAAEEEPEVEVAAAPAPVKAAQPRPAPAPAKAVEPEPAPAPAKAVEPEPAPPPARAVEAEPEPAAVTVAMAEPARPEPEAARPAPAPEPAATPRAVAQEEEVVEEVEEVPEVPEEDTPPPPEEQPAEESPPPPAEESPPPAEESPPPAEESPPPAEESPPPAAEEVPPPPPPEERPAEVESVEEVPPPPPAEEQPRKYSEVEERVEISGALKDMTWVGFQQTRESSRVFVKTNEPVKYRVVEEGDNLVVLELENAKIPLRNNRRFLDTHFFDSAVTLITPREIEGVSRNVRIEIQLKNRVPYNAGQEDNMVFINFQRAN